MDVFPATDRFGVDIPEITTVVCALALIASAYLAHAVKAGIMAIGAGQWQAGLSLGFNRWQTLWFIVLPQALRMMVPSFINQWISLIKDTSLAYIVGVNELTFWLHRLITAVWFTRWKSFCLWHWSILFYVWRWIYWLTALIAALAHSMPLKPKLHGTFMALVV